MPIKVRKAKLPPMTRDEKAIQKALLDSVGLIKSEIARYAVAEALERGDVNRAVELLRFDVGQDFLRSVLPAKYRDIFEKAGETASLKIKASFQVVNPRSVEFASARAGELVREWGNSSQDAVKSLISRGITDGIPPRKLAKDIVDTGIGLTDRQALAVERFRTRLENNPEMDLSDAQIAARTQRYHDRLLRQRGETIARTETILASREGTQEAWRQAADEGLIDPATMVQEWVVAEDERLCDDCGPLDGETAPMGSNFPGEGGSGPPVHPNCRCDIILVPAE